jgi:hypothetical protein
MTTALYPPADLAAVNARTAARKAALPEWARRLEDLIAGLTDEASPQLTADTVLLVNALARAAILDPRNLSRELLQYENQTEYMADKGGQS